MNKILMFKEETWKTFNKQKSTNYTINYLNSKFWSKSRKYTELSFEDTLIKTPKCIAKIQTHMIETVKKNVFQGSI